MKNIKNKLFYIIIVCSVLLVIVSVGTYAKYIGNSIWDYYIESQGFYFFSDKLSGEKNVNNGWNGTPVLFDIRNYNEENEVSDFQIEYEITCTITSINASDLECSVNGSGTNTYTGVLEQTRTCQNTKGDGVNTSNLNESTCTSRGYTWIDGNTSINNFFEINKIDPNTEIGEVTVEIEAKSLSPYSKTLKGEFYLKENAAIVEEEIIFEHQSYSDYEKVIITNNSYKDRTFFLRWDQNILSIAKGDYIISGVSLGNINEIEFDIAKGETLTYSYYKKNSSDEITIEDFILLDKPEPPAIRVSSIELYSTTGGAVELSPATFTEDTTKINLSLPSDTSTFTYVVTIENTTNDYYHLKGIDQLLNTAKAETVTNGMSLYHEFAPGTLSTFTLTYKGISNLTQSELVLEVLYEFALGEVYKDETLNGATPEIIDGLVPISYDETLNEWVKADLIENEWYDYSIMKWANAASVISSQRDFYTEAEAGTVVSMDHMTSMLVWIPRYSYTIRETLGFHVPGAGSVSLTTPGAIDIIFPGIETTHLGSATYTGTEAENYYTPSSFCWGNSCDDPTTRSDEENEEIKGFWIAKFEASKVNNILYSKPNMTPMINYTIAATFYYVQELMNGTNGYNNYGYVGYVDAHLIKNTEWGAIAYLSQSIYGKYGNPDYTGANKEIYLNTCSTYRTGIGGSSAADGRTTASCYNSDHMYDSYNGMGASTTGNIYGVYDMIGGTFDRVMGIVLGPNGEFIPDLSGFTSLPEGRYINIYPYGTYTQGDISPIKGDGLTETLYFYSDRYLGDPRFSSTNYYDYHWLYRGGSLFFSNTAANGIFSYTLFNGQADSHHSSRFTITMTGSLVTSL